MYRYFITFVEGSSTYISSWKSKGLSNEKISSITTSNYNQAQRLVCNNARIELNFSTDLLKPDKVTCNHGPIVNIYIVYKLNTIINDSGVTLKNCLFGAVKLTKNAGYGINTNILDMVLDLIQEELFHTQVEEMFLFSSFHL